MKPTFGQVFAFSLVGLIAILAVLFHLVSSSSRETIRQSSENIRDEKSGAIAERITRFLGEAPETVRQFQREVDHGLVAVHEARDLDPVLLALLLANRNLSELTLTYGEDQGFDDAGEVKLAPQPRGQRSVVRTTGPNNEEHLLSRYVHQENGVFVAQRRELSTTQQFATAPWVREAGGTIPDPTTHPTFTTPASKDFRGRLLWSDLHWSQLDGDLPEAQRRVEVSVQQTIVDANGQFVGVLRAGLLTEQLDGIVRQPLAAGPHRTFICDFAGQLITRLAPADQLEEVGDDLRIAPAKLPPEIAAALASPVLHAATESATSVSGVFRANGEDYFVTFRALPKPQTQDWVIGVVVPQAYYFGQLTAIRQRLLAVLLGVMVLLVAAGGVILRGVRRAQAQITRESLKMNAFDFTPTEPSSPFRDVTDVLESQEKAKAAMRAMSKYVPIDLVRRLYREKSEPMLGAELIEVTLMFTDIKDFTTLCEELTPNELADALGRYLEVMAGIIQREAHGTIDKFIGDAIMTFWNAPETVADHARIACGAALRCRAAGAVLGQSVDWGTWPAFGTRFGLHCAPALIGHFGARDRMNYTAMGDAVNLASRLEGLNKQYGTTIIASEPIVKACGGNFEFRLLDKVAVKGKSEAIRIYELLGRKGEAGVRQEIVAGYEKAFAAYSARDFSTAVEILARQPEDGPSAKLLERCRIFLKDPPPPDWDGIYIATMK